MDSGFSVGPCGLAHRPWSHHDRQKKENRLEQVSIFVFLLLVVMMMTMMLSLYLMYVGNCFCQCTYILYM
jgi:hypothetical protein